MEQKNSFQKQLVINRAFGLFVAVAVVGIGFLYKAADPSAFNPWWERLTIAGLSLIPVLLSFLGNDFLKKNFDYLMYPMYYAIVPWIVQLAVMNDLSGDYTSTVLLAVVAGGMVPFRKSWHLTIFLLLFVFLSTFFGLRVTNPETDKFVFVGLVAIGAVVAHLLDISRQNILKQVKEGEELLKKYLDTVGTMVIVLSNEGKIQTANKKTASVLGHPLDEIIGKNWFETFVLPGMRDGVAQVYKKLTVGKVQRVEYEIVTKDGKELLSNWFNSVVQGDDGEAIGIISTGEDITKKRQDDEKLVKLNKLMVGRELKMKELKLEIARLKGEKAMVKGESKVKRGKKELINIEKGNKENKGTVLRN